MTVTSIVNTNDNSAVVVGTLPAILGAILAQALAAAEETALVHADRLATDQALVEAQQAALAAQGYAAALQLAAGNYVPALLGDVVTPPGSILTTIQPNVVTNAKLAKMPAMTIKGNDTNAQANADDLTVARLMVMLTDFVSDTPGLEGKHGLVPAPAIGDAAAKKLLCADGTWRNVPVMVGDTGTGGTAGLVPAPPPGSAASNWFFNASGAFMPLPTPTAEQHVIVSAPANSSGQPTTLPSTVPATQIYTQNVTPTTPLVAHACTGFDLHGPKYRYGICTNNLTWASLIPSTRNYLFLHVREDNTCEPVHSTLPPVYIRGGSPAVTLGQFTFDVVAKVAYVGDGATATPTPWVPMGHCDTDGSTVISSAPYAINRQFDSGWTVVSVYTAGATFTINTNLGLIPLMSSVSVMLQCVTPEAGYSVGDVTLPANIHISATALTVSYVVASTGNMAIYDKGTGVIATITPAKWQIKILVNRPLA